MSSVIKRYFTQYGRFPASNSLKLLDPYCHCRCVTQGVEFLTMYDLWEIFADVKWHWDRFNRPFLIFIGTIGPLSTK